MSKRTAAALLAGFLALSVYVAFTVGALVRDLNSMGRPEPKSGEVALEAPSDPARVVQLNENRADSGVRPARKRRIRSVGHHSRRTKQDATTSWLTSSLA
jgi:hypothetical protein